MRRIEPISMEPQNGIKRFGIEDLTDHFKEEIGLLQIISVTPLWTLALGPIMEAKSAT